MSVRVTAIDDENGDHNTEELPPNGYVLVVGERMELAGKVRYKNGTIVLTLKRKELTDDRT